MFNKLFYEKMDENQSVPDIKHKADRIIKSEFYEKEIISSPVAEQTFRLKTVYPGLLAGVGYAHGTSNEDDIKVGFSFDFVTGQPYIPGSSVKGVIRDVFSDPEIVAEILSSDALKKPFPEACDIKKAVMDIEESIFEGNDIFFDAVIVRGDTSGKVMGFDYITHHPSETEDPNPVKMLKVLPDVIFEFRFKLCDTVITLDSGEEYKISAGAKKYLFIEIIKTFGVGAKTNTGYGNFVDAKKNFYSYPAEKNSLPAAADNSNPQSGNRRNTEHSNKGQRSIDRIKCPKCGKINFRYKRDSKEENWNWKKGVCFDSNCRGKLFE